MRMECLLNFCIWYLYLIWNLVPMGFSYLSSDIRTYLSLLIPLESDFGNKTKTPMFFINARARCHPLWWSCCPLSFGTIPASIWANFTANIANILSQTAFSEWQDIWGSLKITHSVLYHLKVHQKFSTPITNNSISENMLSFKDIVKTYICLLVNFCQIDQ